MPTELAKRLGVVKITRSVIQKRYKRMFPRLFSGKVGKLEGYQLKFLLDNSVKPVRQAHRRVPCHLRQAVEAELDRQLSEGLIELTIASTEWLSPIHVVPQKCSRVRICTDARA